MVVLSGQRWVVIPLLLCSMGWVASAVQANQLVIQGVVEEAQVVKRISGLGEVVATRHVELQPSVTERVVGVHFNDGDWVKEGQLLLTLDQSEVRAQLAELAVKLQDAERQLARLTPLLARNDVSQAAVDEAQLAYNTLLAQRDLFNVRLERLVLRAPFAGRLGKRMLNEGAMASPSLVVTDLIELDQVYVDFNLPARFLTQVAVGQTVELTSVLLGDAGLTGQVETIFSRLDPATRTFAVRAKVANADYALLPGMGLSISLNQPARRLLRVAETAIVPMADQTFIYVLTPQADSDLYKVERREVVLGDREPGWVELVTGAQLGETVVAQGALRVRPGQLVKVTDQLHQISDFAQ